ncbi:hypothetical protein FHR94_001942 [Halomonas cerina]|uniref:Uncharacterized protein n=1 Tax=Halomonas cerina TaxID=447424 RepID=A0A839V9I1_9GAMM|nr:hypothetical protein [Halomonas cerina]
MSSCGHASIAAGVVIGVLTRAATDRLDTAVEL